MRSAFPTRHSRRYPRISVKYVVALAKVHVVDTALRNISILLALRFIAGRHVVLLYKDFLSRFLWLDIVRTDEM